MSAANEALQLTGWRADLDLFGGKTGRVALDQLRTVDRERLRKRLGVLPAAALNATLVVLQEMFAL